MDRYGNVSALFKKKFIFLSYTEIPRKIFEAPKWDIPILQEKKTHLNNVKAQLSKYDLDEWSRHTKHNDPSSFVTKVLKEKIEPELLTQAWCKFYEILKQFKIVPIIKSPQHKLLSVHLCEAPGGFISALNHYIKFYMSEIEWNWLAMTLNPQYEGNKLSEMIPDDRLLRLTRNQWCFGLDNTGDITKFYNYVDLIGRIEEKVMLVTADGSIDCMCDPGNQENLVAYLKYCETITALSILGEGGAFVLKMFTMFEHSTICLLYLLNISFRKICAFKPCTSKAGNSEIYIICLCYKGLDSLSAIWEALLQPYKDGHFNEEVAMFDLSLTNERFLKEIIVCADYFMNLQIETITNNIDNFRKRDALSRSLIHHTKMRVADLFRRKYFVRKISPSDKLVPDENIFSRILNIKCFPTCRIYRMMSVPTDQVVSIKYGKVISAVEHSMFCDLEEFDTFDLFFKRHQDYFSLYNRIYMDLCKDYSILNRNDLNCSSYSEFQREFIKFFECHNLEKDLVLLNIPFVTSFLVGFLYLLCIVYEEIVLYNFSGLILRKVKNDMKPKFMEMMYSLKSFYDNPPQNSPFQVDILEIVNPDLIMHNDFHSLVCIYNNNLIKLNK